ncbi:MAG TPA: amidohydrolase, partial [Thermococcus paralvinellae]|nr:amidohydrolase [Thermococcus paralvinellae]
MKAIVSKYVLDANGIRENVAVLIEDNKILDVVPKDKLKEYDVDEIFGGKNYLLIPGLI